MDNLLVGELVGEARHAPLPSRGPELDLCAENVDWMMPGVSRAIDGRRGKLAIGRTLTPVLAALRVLTVTYDAVLRVDESTTLHLLAAVPSFYGRSTCLRRGFGEHAAHEKNAGHGDNSRQTRQGAGPQDRVRR